MIYSLRTSVLVAVTLAVMIAGCSGALPTSEDPDDEIAETKILQEIESVDTYQYEMTQTIETADGEETVIAEGTVDESANRSHVSSTAENELISENETIQIEEYILNNTMYASVDGEWFQMELENDVWKESAQLASQTEFIEAGDLEKDGTKTIAGVETTVVTVESTPELRSELENSPNFQGMGASVEDVTYELYIDEETNYIHGVNVDLTMTTASGEVSMTTEMRISDHNEPVDIELPEDADTATTGQPDAV